MTEFVLVTEPGEPIFTVAAHDRDAAMLVRIWCMLRLQQIELGTRPETDRAQVSSAFRIATEMDIWHREHRTRQQMDALEFDDRGIPTTGEHARKAHNTTSGATDA